MMNKRIIIFGSILFTALFTIDFFLTRYSSEEKKSQVTLELIQSDKVLSNELYMIFYSLEDDFSFFEKRIKTILNKKRAQEDVTTLIDFLNTHPHYFKVRLTDNDGRELFKLVQSKTKTYYEESKGLFDLSNEVFFNDLKLVSFNEFYFSSMEANVINGKIETPLRPTIRVSKRIKLDDNQDALLIFNIDGKRILNLFKNQSTSTLVYGKALVDHKGQYVASFPILEESKYTLEKVKIDDSIQATLLGNNENQGAIESKGDVVVYTKLPLPRSSEKWSLISKLSNQTLKISLYKERLTRLFWECLSFIILLFLFWRDEKKRHKEQVVQVLLKERSEFIQNVSHQLKTPLAIIFNYLSDHDSLLQNRLEAQREVEHLIKVVEDLLLLSQIDSLKQIPLIKENILEILNETIELVAIKAKQKSVSIRLNIQEDLVDSIQLLEKNVLPELLKSAFFNLLDNAIDYSPQNDFIELSIGFRGSRALIIISDHGPGVNPDLISSLFRPYTRDNSTGRKGSGLGLSITKKIIELHSGEIRYVSSSVGATFQVLL